MDVKLPSDAEAQGMRVTIAVMELVGGEPFDRCLRRAITEAKSTQSDVLAICRSASSLDVDSFGYDKLIVCENTGETLLERRLEAVRRSNTDILAMIEDTTRPPTGWIEGLQRHFGDSAVGAVWGPIHISLSLPAADRALGFLDYGRFATHTTNGRAMPGNCMSIRKSYLPDLASGPAIGMMEIKLVEQLLGHGRRIEFAEEMVAEYETRDRYNTSLLMRFHHGRLYAGDRYSSASFAGRIIGGVRALGVPIVLSWRCFQMVVRRSPVKRWPAEFFWIGVMSVAAAAGEGAGAVLGAGRSHDMWR